MTYLWLPGLPVRVESDAIKTPQAFEWQGARHGVRVVTNRWRLDETWWAGHVRRDYFKLATETGLLVVLYWDWVSGGWFLERLWD